MFDEEDVARHIAIFKQDVNVYPYIFLGLSVYVVKNAQQGKYVIGQNDICVLMNSSYFWRCFSVLCGAANDETSFEID